MANNGQSQATLAWQPLAALTSLDYADVAEVDQSDLAVTGSSDGTLILWDTGTTLLAEDAYPDVQALIDWLAKNRYVDETAE